MEPPLSFPSDASLENVAAAYATRDGRYYPGESLVQRAERMRRHMEKLGWYPESDAVWHHRVHHRASDMLRQAPPQATVEQIWHEARLQTPRRLGDERRGGLLAAVAEAMPLAEIYTNFFSLGELTILGW